MSYLQDLDYVPDVLVVNTQESFPERTEWEVRLQESILEVRYFRSLLKNLHPHIMIYPQPVKKFLSTIQDTLGPSHVLFHSCGLGSLHTAVFLRRDLIW